MAMSKKNYEAIAVIIENNLAFNGIMAANLFVEDLADYFKQENPRFNRDKFLEACGI